MNRCLVLTADEGAEQTRAIHARQRARRTLAGMLAKERKNKGRVCGPCLLLAQVLFLLEPTLQR